MEYWFTSHSLSRSGNAIFERETGVGDWTQQKSAVPDPLPIGTTLYAPPGACLVLLVLVALLL